MAARGTRKAADQPQGTDTGEGLTEHPVQTPDTLETATEGAEVEGVKYGEPREAQVENYAERPYAEALSDEHAKVLRDAGQHPDEAQ